MTFHRQLQQQNFTELTKLLPQQVDIKMMVMLHGTYPSARTAHWPAERQARRFPFQKFLTLLPTTKQH